MACRASQDKIGSVSTVDETLLGEVVYLDQGVRVPFAAVRALDAREVWAAHGAAHDRARSDHTAGVVLLHVAAQLPQRSSTGRRR